MNLDKIPKAGTTAIRKAFWDKARDTVLSLQKRAGANVNVNEQTGQGTVINVQRETGVRGECCGIEIVSAITSIHLEWDFHITCRCDETYHLERTWTPTETFPPPDGTFLFRCFNDLPQFQAGSTDPLIGYVYGQGVRLPLGSVMTTWATADLDINQNDCNSMKIWPGFTTSIIECFESPFGLATGAPFIIPLVDLIGTHNYTYGPIECPHDPGFFYDAAWTLVIS